MYFFYYLKIKKKVLENTQATRWNVLQNRVIKELTQGWKHLDLQCAIVFWIALGKLLHFPVPPPSAVGSLLLPHLGRCSAELGPPSAMQRQVARNRTVGLTPRLSSQHPLIRTYNAFFIFFQIAVAIIWLFSVAPWFFLFFFFKMDFSKGLYLPSAEVGWQYYFSLSVSSE